MCDLRDVVGITHAVMYTAATHSCARALPYAPKGNIIHPVNLSTK